MILNLYRLVICIAIAFLLYESFDYMFADVPISNAWANFSLLLCCMFLWERLVISIKIQQILDKE
jgi:hypothetical protein